MHKKRALIKMVFEQAKKELPNRSKTSLAAYLSALFEEKFNFSRDEKTFSRYYRKLIEQNGDYNIDEQALDTLSKYVGFADFSSFCENGKEEKVQQYGSVKITFSDQVTENNVSGTHSGVVINITNAPVFNIPEFLAQHKSSFGWVGLLIMLGFFADRSGYFKKNEDIATEVRYRVEPLTERDEYAVEQPRMYFVGKPEPETVFEKRASKEKRCMYWNGEHYVTVVCDDKITGAGF